MIRILLAEDNPADVYLLREAFAANGDCGVELIVVNDGEEAMEYLSGLEVPGSIDLVVLDLNLPKSDGRDVLQGIRENPKFGEVPVVILTSSDSPRDRAAAIRLGADSYLTKPSDLDEFMALGSKLLSHANRTSDLARAAKH